MQTSDATSSRLTGLDAIAAIDAKVLILGSMPGQQSLAQQHYYAHPRNAFWKIMAMLFDFDFTINYADKLLIFQQQKLALWDVIQSCERQGSLDSHILNNSITSNDFAGFFTEHPHISHIFFNGSRAYQDYQKYVKPQLAASWQTLPCTRLPSTSPAMASLSFEQKLIIWKQIPQVLGN